jgi:hypothetical protein
MTDTTQALMQQMLEWIGHRPRDYGEVMDAWRTSCPRLTIWEDACIEGLVVRDPLTRKISLTAKGAARVSPQRTPPAPQEHGPR